MLEYESFRDLHKNGVLFVSCLASGVPTNAFCVRELRGTNRFDVQLEPPPSFT